MSRNSAWCARASAAVVAAAATATLAAQPRPSFRTDTWLVVLHAVATTEGGALITDLERRLITVYENGKAQPIKVFRKEDVPISLGLLIDNSGSMRTLRAKVSDAAHAFVRASNAQDQVFVINFADTPRPAVPLVDPVRTQYPPRGAGPSLEGGLPEIDAVGGTALRDAIIAAEQYLRGHATCDRKVLLLITDGNDNASEASSAELRKVIDETFDTTIFAVGLRRDVPAGVARHRQELEDVTARTGGSVIWVRSTDEIQAVALDLSRAVRQQYTIAYAPLNQALDGTYRTVRVKVAPPGRAQIRTRTGYRATPAAIR
jgi:VWFA-related protein